MKKKSLHSIHSMKERSFLFTGNTWAGGKRKCGFYFIGSKWFFSACSCGIFIQVMNIVGMEFIWLSFVLAWRTYRSSFDLEGILNAFLNHLKIPEYCSRASTLNPNNTRNMNALKHKVQELMFAKTIHLLPIVLFSMDLVKMTTFENPAWTLFQDS